MVGSSKILTVKYGTFSCTAEGFEDPLGAVKDTTHFFRHVVRDDRFFGAEPPRFDAALAEEMLRGQLAADLRDGHLTLRATPAPADPRTAFMNNGATRAAASDGARAEDVEDAEDDQDRAHDKATAASQAGPVPELEEVEPLPPPADSTVDVSGAAADLAAPAVHAPEEADDRLAAKLARIRAVVGATTAFQPNDDAGHSTADAHGTAGEGPANDLDEEDEDTVQAPALSNHAGAEHAVAQAQSAAFDAVRHATQGAHANDASAAPGTEAGEPEGHANATDDVPPTVSKDENPAAGLVSGDDGLEDVPETIEDNAASANQDADRGALAAAIVEHQTEGTPEHGATDPAVAEKTPTAAEDHVDSTGKAEGTDAAIGELAADAGASDGADEEADDLAAARASDTSPDAATAPVLGERSDRLVAESSLAPEDEADLARELAAVRAELQKAAIAAPAAPPFRLDNPILSDEGDDTEKDDRDETALVVDKPTEDPRQPDDSFLARTSAGARKAVRLASPARAMLTEKTVVDSDASRLLDQTDSQLDEPEGNRRRNAIAHLRAAVAATRADRALHADDPDAETERYREDLAKVVRPRRPKVLRSIRSERPAPEPQDAPLQLVSQQRADEARTEPVRPRRVSIADDIGPPPGFDAGMDVGGGFADYAESVGATRLPDLLEAAAAYMAFVEGRDQFSRPQLMTILQCVEGGTATREERLRSFGRLLRDGKIEKTRGGRFTASDRIGFRPDARQVG